MHSELKNVLIFIVIVWDIEKNLLNIPKKKQLFSSDRCYWKAKAYKDFFKKTTPLFLNWWHTYHQAYQVFCMLKVLLNKWLLFSLISTLSPLEILNVKKKTIIISDEIVKKHIDCSYKGMMTRSINLQHEKIVYNLQIKTVEWAAGESYLEIEGKLVWFKEKRLRFSLGIYSTFPRPRDFETLHKVSFGINKM